MVKFLGAPLDIPAAATAGNAAQKSYVDDVVAAVSTLMYRGAYSGATAYVVDDVVTFAGSSYVALEPATGVSPTAGASNATWDLLAAKGDPGDPGAGAVTSVAGRDGDVVLAKTDVGLSNVDNTADTAKPVSTAQQTALNLKANLASPTFTGTVAGVTKTHVGLSNVDNTADSAKPVSTAQQTALNLKAPRADPTFTGWVAGVTKTHVGLSNVDNTADTDKPVSAAQLTALDLKAPLASPTFTGTVSGVTKAHVGLGSVDNTADTDKPVSAAQQTALSLKANLASPTLTGTPAAPTAGAGTNTTQLATTAFVTAAISSADTAQEVPLTAADLGLLAINFDPVQCNTNSTLTGGAIFMVRVPIRVAATISNIHFQTSGGASPTGGQNWVALLNTSGTVLSTGAADSVVSAGTGYKSVSLTAPQAVSAGFVYFALLFNATTVPALACISSFPAVTNAALAAAQLRWARNGTSQTTITNRTMSSNVTGAALAIWIGLS